MARASTSVDPDAPRVVVPIALDALPVNRFGNFADDQPHWAWVRPEFDRVADGRVLGTQIEPPPFTTAENPPAGIHLHWALPDALTHGLETTGGDIEYPKVPDRWMLLRIYIDVVQSRIDLTPWIIESDRVVELPPEAAPPASSIPWPAGAGKWLSCKKYLGASMPYDQWPGGPGAGDLPLTAIGAGDPIFAAYAPACRNVFAFHDSLEDLVLPIGDGDQADQVHLTYLITGWYSQPGADPLTDYADPWIKRMHELGWSTVPPYRIGGVDVESRSFFIDGYGDLSPELPEGALFQVNLSTGNDGTYTVRQASYSAADSRYTVAVDRVPSPIADGVILASSTELPTQTLYHGMVYGVPWAGPEAPYATGVPEDPLTVSVGNNFAEALATMMVAGDPAAPDQLARLLEAVQYHLLDEIDSPSGLLRLEEQLHEREFSRYPGGLRWQIETTPEKTSQQESTPALPLSETLGELLGEFNAQQQRLEKLTRRQAGLAEEIYFAWFKRTLREQAERDDALPIPLDPPTVEQLTTLVEQLLSRYPEAQEGLALCKDALEQQRASLAGQLPAGHELVTAPSSRFWLANDPVVMLQGPAAGRSQKHGEDGRLTDDGSLACRFQRQTITGIEVTPPALETVTVGEKTLRGAYGYFPRGAPVPGAVERLLVETLLLDPTTAPLLALESYALAGVHHPTQQQVDALANTVRQTQESIFDFTAAQPPTFQGTLPSAISTSPWAPPWNPMLLEWRVRWFPSYSQDDRQDDDWQLTRDWQLGDLDFAWTGETAPLKNPSGFYAGRILLTPQAADNLMHRLEQLAEQLPEYDPRRQELLDMATAAGDLEVLSQTLSGLGSSLAMRPSELQLPAISLGQAGDDPLAQRVAAVVGDGLDAAPLVREDAYFPGRAGHAILTDLRLIDGFGQIKQVVGNDLPATPRVAESLRTEGDDLSAVLRLAPRFCQPARLDFGLRSAQDDAIETNSVASTSPVCGWCLPNHLDRSLMFYSADGTVLGGLQLLDGSLGNGRTGVRWVGVPGAPAALGALPRFDNRHLEGFVKALIDLGAEGEEALRDLLPVIDETLWTVEPLVTQQDQSLSMLTGRPLLIARASLGLQLSGLAVADQSWQATRTQIRTGDRQTEGFTGLEFTVQLGGLDDSQDGLIGYFFADDYRKFYATQGAECLNVATALASSYIEFDSGMTLRPIGDGHPVPFTMFLTLLLDPRAAVQATSGILPIKKLEVPPDIVADALSAIDVTFATGPLLESDLSLAMPLPALEHGDWSWIDRPGVTLWRREKDIQTVNDRASLEPARQQIREGWLNLSHAFKRN